MNSSLLLLLLLLLLLPLHSLLGRTTPVMNISGNFRTWQRVVVVCGSPLKAQLLIHPVCSAQSLQGVKHHAAVTHGFCCLQ
jgi:hypothetical protein